MNTENQTVRLTFVPLVSKGWDVFLQNFRSTLPLLLICFLCGLLTSILLPRANHTDDMRTFQDLPWTYFRILMLFMLIILSFLPNMAINKMVESSELGTPVSWHAALRHVVTGWGSSIIVWFIMILVMAGWMILSVVFGIIIWTGLSSFALSDMTVSSSALYKLIVAGVMFLTIIPVFILMLSWLFAQTAIALRGFSVKDALDYSRRLTKGQLWRVFGLLIAFTIMQSMVNMIVSRLPLLPFAILNAAILSVTGLFVTTTLTLYFLNLEAMKEGKEGKAVTIEP